MISNLRIRTSRYLSRFDAFRGRSLIFQLAVLAMIAVTMGCTLSALYKRIAPDTQVKQVSPRTTTYVQATR